MIVVLRKKIVFCSETTMSIVGFLSLLPFFVKFSNSLFVIFVPVKFSNSRFVKFSNVMFLSNQFFFKSSINSNQSVIPVYFFWKQWGIEAFHFYSTSIPVWDCCCCCLLNRYAIKIKNRSQSIGWCNDGNEMTLN